MALRGFLENAKTPLVIKDHLKNWSLIDYTAKEWCELFGSADLVFRVGDCRFRSHPQWEGQCRRSTMNLKEFFEINSTIQSEWHYYDYRDMSSIFNDEGEIFNAFSWGDLGFPDISPKESTLWIGNAGAHTPCHQDAHGFNLVAQIHGRKMWILIDPLKSYLLEPTRVPYEETTIYSRLNFFTPGEPVTKLSGVYKIILEPGQVLCVPRHWWHYVENIETAISINTWIPCAKDVESQMDEALVQKFIHAFQTTIDENLVSLPEELIVTDPVLEHLANKCWEYRLKEHKTAETGNVSGVETLQAMTEHDLHDFVKEKSLKYCYDYSKSETESINTTEMVINSFCHPDNIKIAREHFLKQYKQKSKKFVV